MTNPGNRNSGHVAGGGGALKRFALPVCSFLLVGGVVAAVVAIQSNGKMKQGASVPAVLKGKASEIMIPRQHGTCVSAVQAPLRWNADVATGDNICCFNRHYAERSYVLVCFVFEYSLSLSLSLSLFLLSHVLITFFSYHVHVALMLIILSRLISSGSWTSTTFLTDQRGKTTTFYDSVTGKPLFKAPVGRTWEEFESESRVHGWPSFRDDEVITGDTIVLENGEVVSLEGTHLGHNLPDGQGNRYCINLVSIAGMSLDGDDDAAVALPAPSTN